MLKYSANGIIADALIKRVLGLYKRFTYCDQYVEYSDADGAVPYTDSSL